jgi:predicted acetyltransferase
MAALEIRAPQTDELDAIVDLSELVFHERLSDAERARRRALLESAPSVSAFDGGELVGNVTAYPFELSIPGGALPCAGISLAGVRPTHRRRGLLTALLERQLDDALGAGRPLAGLWAAEGAIYGRFGFGAATRGVELELRADRPLVWRLEPDARALRLIAPADAPATLGPIYDRARTRRAGMPARTADWWRRLTLRDEGAPAEEQARGIVRVAVLADAGYVAYRALGETAWVVDLAGDTPAVEAALWRYMASIDGIAHVRAETRPVDDAVGRMLESGDDVAAERGVHDALWLRLLDVGAALRARAWGAELAVTLRLTDARRPANVGTWRLEAGPGAPARWEPARGTADLALDARELAAAYLGGVTLARLAAAGLVDERTPGAVEALDAALRTPRAPFMPDHF